MSEIINIVAGNLGEYRRYICSIKVDGRRYRYVKGPEDLKGFTSETLNIFYIGTYMERSDINEILDEIKLINEGGN